MKKLQSKNHFILAAVFAFMTICLVAQSAVAQVQIVTSVTDLAAIASEIGGDKVEVISLAKGYQDPHFVDAKPTFVTQLNQADLLVFNGLELEVGWLPILITGARNSNITRSNTVGHYDASTSIQNKLEVPTTPIDRSMGDIHPGGNPHFMLDPRNGIVVARGIAARLIRLDPENAEYYEQNYNNFKDTLTLKISEWDAQLSAYKGTKVVTYHKNWTYFLDWAGFIQAGTIEPLPGVPPTPSHVANIITTIEAQNIPLIISANYYPQKTPQIIAQQTGATSLILPSMVGGEEGITTYAGLFDVLVTEITSALSSSAAN
ncbi:MAG: metal ABC transporter substrate-binding protein [Thermodesulfobacteriota bacterium]